MFTVQEALDCISDLNLKIQVWQGGQSIFIHLKTQLTVYSDVATLHPDRYEPEYVVIRDLFELQDWLVNNL